MPLGLIASVGSFLFIYGAILLSFQIADRTLIGIMEVHLPGKEGYFSLLEVVTFLIICTLVLGFMVNLNYISIHRYYRDRLMESYLPDSDSAQANETGPAYKADKAKLHG